jgi:hypothetical protein
MKIKSKNNKDKELAQIKLSKPRIELILKETRLGVCSSLDCYHCGKQIIFARNNEKLAKKCDSAYFMCQAIFVKV